MRAVLVHGLSWIGLAAPTTPWLRATVSSLLAILDARRWGMTRLTVKLQGQSGPTIPQGI
ncbi:hypothetical protein TIFTF001_027379 [Ficus carica]|uniref:Uncharacterized protein n=1 Tax=Ficus carica TaxID=3494 RepID=A0AA88DP36_FICCA|nr:hypothetical protein TIFTF001_027379 [Ficus carica]